MKKNHPTTHVLLAILSLLCLLFSSSFSGFIPVTTVVNAPISGIEPVSNFPTITNFVHTLNLTSPETVVTGVYIPNTFAYGVVQQPAGSPGFVSAENDVLTQFGMAGSYGTTGLLAHNNLAGTSFSFVQPGQTIVAVQGDGTLEYYHVYAVEKYQALSPNSPYSNFRSLDVPGQDLSASELFMHVYAQPGNLVLQTCIANGDQQSWGRLFILAEPISEFVPQPVQIEPGC